MGCAGCAVNIEKRVGSLHGIIAASVNFASNTILIEYDPALITPERIRSEVRAIGYDLDLKDPEDNPEDNQGAHPESRRDNRRTGQNGQNGRSNDTAGRSKDLTDSLGNHRRSLLRKVILAGCWPFRSWCSQWVSWKRPGPDGVCWSLPCRCFFTAAAVFICGGGNC